MNLAELIQSISSQGEVDPINLPLPPRENHFLWVEKGAIDCFIRLPSQKGSNDGALLHLFRIPQGKLCPTIHELPPHFSGALVWTALPNTQFRQLACDTLSKAVVESNVVDEFELALAHWLDFSSREQIYITAPTLYTEIKEQSHHRPALGDIISTSADIAWVGLKKGSFRWLQNPHCELSVGRENKYLPTHRNHWLSVEEESLIENVDIEYLIEMDLLTHAIRNYFQLLLEHRMQMYSEEQLENFARMKQRQQSGAQYVSRAIQNLVGVMDEADNNRILYKESLIGALRKIEKAQGIDFRLDELGEELHDEHKDPIHLISAFGSTRYRKVALKDDWWSKDSGPLLLQEAESSKWYCALPRRRGGYNIYSGYNDESFVMDQNNAMKFRGFAASFYRSFPNTPLGIMDVLKFAFHGLQRDAATVIIMSAFAGLLGIAMPIVTGQVVESVIPNSDIAALWIFGAVLTTTALATTLFGVTRVFAQLRMESKMDGTVQAAIWDRVLKLPVTFFKDYSAGDLSQRVNVIHAIRSALSGATIATLLAGMFSIFNLLLLFYYNGALALIACALVAGAVVIVIAIGILRLRHERKIIQQEGQLTGVVFEYLSGVTKIRASASENRAFFNWSERFSEIKRLHFKAQQLSNLDNTLFSGYRLAAIAIIFSAVGMSLTNSSADSFGVAQFIAFNAAFGVFFASVIAISSTVLDLVRLIPVYERAKPILEHVPESHGNKMMPTNIQGNIDIRNLRFAYSDGPLVINGITLSVRAGELVAIVGASGSGKSTLLRLLLGFEKITDGSVHYDSQDLTQLDLTALRHKIGVVLQTSKLVPGDIFSNIVGPYPLTLDDAWEAARKIGLDEDIRQMPMGMHTVVSEGASTLSRGQRQRILIARAIITRPRILFFDEASSALDNETQATVLNNIEALKSTRMVIAHRLSTVMHADRIIVIEKGRIIEEGAYEELISSKGAFSKWASRQLV